MKNSILNMLYQCHILKYMHSDGLYFIKTKKWGGNRNLL